MKEGRKEGRKEIIYWSKISCDFMFTVRFFVFREAKQHCSPKSLEESITGIGKLKSVKCNCNGTKVSIMCDKVREMKGYIIQ